MDFTSFRHCEDLSDIEIILAPEDRHYSLHKFPLYTKSEYIRKIVSKDPKVAQVKLQNFPGGPANFERVVDFCYSHYVEITKQNVLQLYLAGCYLSMNGFGNLIEQTERHLTDLLASAKLTRAVGLIVGLLAQGNHLVIPDYKDKNAEEKSGNKSPVYGNYAEEIRNRCVDTIIEIWAKPPSRFPYKRDQGPNIQDLDVRIVRKLLDEGRKKEIRSEVLMNVVREYTERYLRQEIKDEPREDENESLKLKLPSDLDSDGDMEVTKINGDNPRRESVDSSSDEEIVQTNDDDTEQTRTEQDENEQQSNKETNQEQSKNDTQKKVEKPETKKEDNTPKKQEPKAKQFIESEEDKQARENEFAEKLDTLAMELPEKPRTLRDENSVRWIVQALEIANRKKCECRERLLYAASTVLAQIPEQELRTMTPDLVYDLLREAGQSGFHFANTVCVITDFYILDKVKTGSLDKETFIKLAKALPDGFRTNVDTLYEAYGILAKDCTPQERDGILGALDLSRLSEDTMGRAYKNRAIDADQLIPALIDRCKRLRGWDMNSPLPCPNSNDADLDKAKEIIKKKEADQYQAIRSRVGTSYTPREAARRPPQTLKQPPPTKLSWPVSARCDTRYEPVKLAPSGHLAASSGTTSLPSSPRHKPILVKPTAIKPVHVPNSARYYHEKPQKPKQLTASAPKPPPAKTGSSLPGTPRKAWTTPHKAELSYVTSENVPDYSSSGIGPDDVRQIFHELALTSPRLSYMYKAQYEIPERDTSTLTPYSPRRAKKY